MSSVHNPILLKAKLIVVARSKKASLPFLSTFALTLINFCCSLCSLFWLTKNYFDFLLIGPLHEIIADHGDGMTENDAKLMQVIDTYRQRYPY